MKVMIENTTKLVTLEINGVSVPARVWQGHVLSYTIDRNSNGSSIACHHCGTVSYNYNDVVERYCSRFKIYHADHPAIPVQAFITLIAPEVRPDDPRIDELTAQFTAELERVAPPRPTVEAIPMRMIL